MSQEGCFSMSLEGSYSPHSSYVPGNSVLCYDWLFRLSVRHLLSVWCSLEDVRERYFLLWLDGDCSFFLSKHLT